MKTWDVIIIGGGLVGLSVSLALRKKGASVLVVERGQPGRESSHAAGGMLVDCPLETAPALQALATASAKMYPEFAHELEVESGVKVDLRDQGTILFPSIEHVRHPQLRSAALAFADLKKLEPELKASSAQPDVFFIKERSVDPRALTHAAWETAKRRGVDFSSGDTVTAVNTSDGCASGATTDKTSFHAAKVVNCAGAWSGQIGPHSFPTRPVKGQMLCLAMQPRDLIKHVIRTPKVYLIPRSDGRLLVGATVEEAGFDKRTDPAVMQQFHREAIKLFPRLESAKILEDWAGLRPGTPDSLPILGETPILGYYVATGHFRDGILLAPVTAKIMADVITGNAPGYDLKAFEASRFGSTVS